MTYKLKIIPSELSRPTITKWYGPLDIDIAKDIDDKVNLLKEELGIGYWIAKKGNHPNSKEFINKHKEIHAYYGIRFKYDAYCAYLTKTESKVRESLELPKTQDDAKLVFDIVARKYNLQLAERRQINGFGKVDRAIHQAKIDGKYVPQATLVYDYMVDGHELNVKNTDEKSYMPNF